MPHRKGKDSIYSTIVSLEKELFACQPRDGSDVRRFADVYGYQNRQDKNTGFYFKASFSELQTLKPGNGCTSKQQWQR